MDVYIDYVVKGIDKDKFVKGMFSYELLWYKGNVFFVNLEYIVICEYMVDVNNYDWIRYIYFIFKLFF